MPKKYGNDTITKDTARHIIESTANLIEEKQYFAEVEEVVKRIRRVALKILKGEVCHSDKFNLILNDSEKQLISLKDINEAKQTLGLIKELRGSLSEPAQAESIPETEVELLSAVSLSEKDVQTVSSQAEEYAFVSEESVIKDTMDKRILTDQMMFVGRSMLTRQLSSRIKDFLNSLPHPAKEADAKTVRRYVRQISRLVDESRAGAEVSALKVVRLLKDYVKSVDTNYSPTDARLIKKYIYDICSSFDMEQEDIADTDIFEEDYVFSLEEAFKVREVKNIDLGNRNLLYASESMDGLMRYVSALAEEEIEVMVRGETGTGKELIAKALHHLSSRKEKPFIALNCTSIPHELLESELFGYKKGAFTGAVKDKPGCLSMVKDGTLFLDEIGDMSVSSQSKLLRVIQEKKFRPVGSYNEDEESFAGRLITATNKDLSEEVSQGRFREDLYYRISGFELNVPSLRKRKEDIIPLTLKLVAGLAQGYSLSREAMEKLITHDFPGNVRELENIVKRALIHKKVRHPHDNIILAEDITVTRKSPQFDAHDIPAL